LEKQTVSEEKDKPRLDEPLLAEVLEAAYAMQRRNRELQKMEPDLDLKRDLLESDERSIPPDSAPQMQVAEPHSKADHTSTLALIVETQHQIQLRHLDLENAMSAVVERLTQIAGASGAAIGMLEDEKVRYRAASGHLTHPVGAEVPVEKALCVACLRSGQVFRGADVNREFLLDTEECGRRGIQSLIAVPIFHDGVVVGALELYYAKAQAFAEQDVHTCQLMAGLITEALARNEEATRKESLASERAAMLEALEKLQPSLAALADTAVPKGSGARTARSTPDAHASTFVCRKCGHELVGQEQFCGNCGSPRSGDCEAPNMQSKGAALWHMREAIRKTPHAHPANDAGLYQELQPNFNQVPADESVADSIEHQVAEPFAPHEARRDQTTEPPELPEAPVGADFENPALANLGTPLRPIPGDDIKAEATALVKPEQAVGRSSTGAPRDFLERLAVVKRPGAWAQLWNSHRGDIYLTIAVILLLGVVWFHHSGSATGNRPTAPEYHRRAPGSDLSLFDRILVNLGLAEAPEPPEYKGNPDTQVWVDLQTALYYCPGTDLYGKTPKGKFSSQREARLDQFEPAYRKACD
jgi:putative methionine-R-sulfoxide reductase with GAF domain